MNSYGIEWQSKAEEMQNAEMQNADMRRHSGAPRGLGYETLR